jgi:hypothetical protein
MWRAFPTDLKRVQRELKTRMSALDLKVITHALRRLRSIRKSHAHIVNLIELRTLASVGYKKRKTNALIH